MQPTSPAYSVSYWVYCVFDQGQMQRFGATSSQRAELGDWLWQGPTDTGLITLRRYATLAEAEKGASAIGLENPGVDHQRPASPRHAWNLPSRWLTYLYQFFDHNGMVLYTGITGNLNHRFWHGHQTHATWWPAVRFGLVQPYPERQAAEDAERTAIVKAMEAGHPVHNKYKTGETSEPSRRSPAAGGPQVGPTARGAERPGARGAGAASRDRGVGRGR